MKRPGHLPGRDKYRRENTQDINVCEL